MSKVKGLRWYVLALVSLGTVLNYVDRNTLGVLAPILREQLNFTAEHYSFVVAAFQLSYSFMQPLAGYIIDLIGLRFGFFLFAAIWGTACALHALAGSWQVMAVFRSMLGIGEAAGIPSCVKTATQWFPPKERSIATGWFNTGTSIGAMIAPPIVVGLSLTWGWQVAFLATGTSAVIFACFWVVLYRNPEDHRLLSEAEHNYIVGDDPVFQPPKPSVKAVLAKRQFWGIAVARFFTEPAWQTFSYWIPLYVVSSRGMDIRQFALFAWLPFLAADIGCIFGGYLSPFCSKRFGLSLINSRIAGIGIGGLSMIAPAFVGMAASPIIVIFLFSLGAFAHQTISTLLYALVTDTFEKQDVATATGCAGMAGYLGGTLFSLSIGQFATTIGYEPLFVCLSIFDIVAFCFVAALLGQRRAPTGFAGALEGRH